MIRLGRARKDKATVEAEADLFAAGGTAVAPSIATNPPKAEAAQPGPPTSSDDRRAYYEQGMVWERHIYRRAVAHARLAWSIAGLSLLMLAAAIGALLFTIPTIRYEPYVIAVDKTTGYMEMVRALKPGDLADDEAVTKANVWRYVLNRETFDRNTLAQNVRVAALLSRSAAARDLEELYAPSNPRALHRTTPDGVVISVQLKSINVLNPRVAQVRFATERRELTQITVQHWVSIVRFEYSRAPMRNEWRIENPLGFQVVEYRRDQESLPAPGASAPG